MSSLIMFKIVECDHCPSECSLESVPESWGWRSTSVHVYVSEFVHAYVQYVQVPSFASIQGKGSQFEGWRRGYCGGGEGTAVEGRVLRWRRGYCGGGDGAGDAGFIACSVIVCIAENKYYELPYTEQGSRQLLHQSYDSCFSRMTTIAEAEVRHFSAE